ncbi:acyl carrier protein [Nonomuraea sp. PA05]|uniref:acyl carrier protein n=1 Tax=Nonomuraea sp. PA05 TaxID=2604466 RepID=UPI001CA33B8A|nr:acyl carrier protein [Nonomuraea sp. PA05]
MDITQVIREFVVTEYLPDTPADELEVDYDLFRNGVINSLDLLRLISWLKDHFGIPVDELDIVPENFRTVANIRDFVASALPASAERTRT